MKLEAKRGGYMHACADALRLRARAAPIRTIEPRPLSRVLEREIAVGIYLSAESPRKRTAFR